MTREEFSTLIIGAKNMAEMKLQNALPHAAQLSPRKIKSIELAQTNFNLSDALSYLKMYHCTLQINGYIMVFVDTLEEIRKHLKHERLRNEWSVIDLAKRSHVSSKIIYAFEDGRCELKIDTFLKLIDAFNITIEID